jgi:hypothetical protein
MTVTSQEGGNLVHDNSPAMTAPGTDPVTPMPDAKQMPDPQLGTSSRVKLPTQPQPGTSYSPTPVTWKAVSDG